MEIGNRNCLSVIHETKGLYKMKDFVVHIIEGGISEFEKTGIYSQYYSFTCKSIGLKTGNRKFKQGITTGFVRKNNIKLFYFEFDENHTSCKIYLINNDIQSLEPVLPDCTITMRD